MLPIAFYDYSVIPQIFRTRPTPLIQRTVDYSSDGWLSGWRYYLVFVCISIFMKENFEIVINHFVFYFENHHMFIKTSPSGSQGLGAPSVASESLFCTTNHFRISIQATKNEATSRLISLSFQGMQFLLLVASQMWSKKVDTEILLFLRLRTRLALAQTLRLNQWFAMYYPGVHFLII